MFADLPAFAGWRFVDVVDGFEVVYTQPDLLRGHTSAVEDRALPLGEVTEVPAAYVRALDLCVGRLDQTYRRLDDCRNDYTSEGGDFEPCWSTTRPG